MKTIRLLTIGNSFSNNALTFLADIAASGGEVTFDVGKASLGGCSLEKHWNIATYSEKHPEPKSYDLQKNEDGSSIKANLREALAFKEWDFVTLQQVSRKSWRRETFQPYLDNLLGLVRKLAPQAKPLLHQTWAYRTDTPYFTENSITQEIMHRRIVENYNHFSSETGCGILPSGEAVNRARQIEGRKFTWPEEDYNYQFPEAPVLPRQEHSLAVGWFWEITNTPEGVPEMRRDSNHLNRTGCYLAGCVWYEILSGLDVTSTTFAPEEVDGDTAKLLRSIAHETAQAYMTSK
ncbi:MAG: DUF4886 domain-containing protein [Planctomycetes bacterium]|nr:DUF4886 domain-containing protein [Planctomycetota bacterium]